ncbi:hypothetical protein DHEL01_v207531 [Diaporthe helianthi]|uniref:Uncharacterized protein n=1 Tax=Diaporthe helianthi TaxID=158607 RepID=A0A2P5HV10_DIAHE|nr:hypothetical protein DHEL01_v207531 [Diaporthe helianthi]
MKGFLDVLVDCTNLEKRGIMYDLLVVSLFRLIDSGSSDLLPFSQLGQAMKHPFYRRSWSASGRGPLRDVTNAFERLKALISGLQECILPKLLRRTCKSAAFLHPTLQDLQVLSVIPAMPVVRDKVMVYKREHHLEVTHIAIPGLKALRISIGRCEKL